MADIFRLSLRQLMGRWRILFIALLAALPTGIILLIRLLGDDPFSFDGEFVGGMMDGMIIAGVMPIVTMALATTAFGNEVEDRTLYFLMLKPISRVSIALAKMLAVFVVAAPLVVASGTVAAVAGGGSGRAVAAIAIALVAGVAAYASVFTWAGLITQRALAFGLVYMLVWEGLLSTFLGGIQYLSIRGYTLALLHGIDQNGFESIESRVIEFPAAIVGVIVAIACFSFLTQYRLRTMDVS